MQDRQYSIKKNPKMLQESFIAASQFMALFYKIEAPNPEQYFTLAAAHYTLAQKPDISRKRCKMHLNSSITLLQNLTHSYQNDQGVSLLANCYARRAEIFEAEEKLPQALQDYVKVLAIFEKSSLKTSTNTTTNTTTDTTTDTTITMDFDRLLIAQTSISIADLIVNHEVSSEGERGANSACDKLEHSAKLHPPIWYIEKALENLSKLPIEEDEILLTQAYAHQIAAMAIANKDLNQAFEHYRLSLQKAFRASNKAACQILGDIYNGLGILYEEQDKDVVIEKSVSKTMDHAMVYFAIALFFYPCYENQENHETQGSNGNQVNQGQGNPGHGNPKNQNPGNQENLSNQGNPKKHSTHNEESEQFTAFPILNQDNCPEPPYSQSQYSESTDLDIHGCPEMLDIIYDSIHRALDPYPYPLPLTLIQNLIDALIFAYFCMMDGSLPNQELFFKLKEKECLDRFAQHIFWLLAEFQRRENRQGRFAVLVENDTRNFADNIQERVFNFLNRPQKNNVVQIKKSCSIPKN
jgi:tetratricopeptide (TPR) repeat protein